MKLKLKLFLKKMFNILCFNQAIKNKILHFFGRDYELSRAELERLELLDLEAITQSTPRGDFIVSLTTFPKRIYSLKWTLYSIFSQDLLPKKVILSLSKEEFGNQILPREILDFQKYGLEILWNSENLRQYNKIIPVMRKYGNEVIITLDDDICYPQGVLRTLFEAYLSDKTSIWTQRARIVGLRDKEILPFFDWKLIKKHDKIHQNKPSLRLFLEGVGGVLYPPHSLYKDALDSSLFMKLSPKADDVWLWAMAVLNGTKIGVVKDNLMANGNMMTISPNDTSLWLDNLISGNDTQLQSIIKAYPQLLEILYTQSMRILQFGKFFPPDLGGIESVIEDVTLSLRNRGVICDVLCSNSKLRYEENVLPCGAKIMRVASFGRLASTSIAPQMIWKLRQTLANYDIIHIHLPDPMANLALLFANTKGKKIILHWHSDIIKQKNLLKLYLPLQNWILKKADSIIVTSEKYKRESAFLGDYLDKCVVIPIGIDKNSFCMHKPNIILPKDKKIILSLGRFAKNKGFEYLIESGKYLSDDYVIFIGGNGNKELTAHFKDLIKKYQLENKVFLLGRINRNNLAYYYSHCHIFVLPSIQESYGIVLIEAMSFKKPVICTKLCPSGVDWINLHNQTGYVIEPKNPKAIIDGIYAIEKRYEELANNAFQRYLENFSLDTMIDSIIALYKKLLRGGYL